MATQSVLARRQRFQSRSDREREKLQAQISTYSIRVNSDRDLAQRNLELQRITNGLPTTVDSTDRLNTFIEHLCQIVDGVMPCQSCGRRSGHELGCSEI